MTKSMFTFELDKALLDDTLKDLKKAVELPRKNITKAVKEAMKFPLAEAKQILRSIPDNYKMKFDDGNTWTKQDIIKNLYLKAEKSSSKDKKVYRLGIRDWKVDLYANFVEFGYTNPKSGEQHVASQFMLDSLDNTADIVFDQTIARILQSLRETGLIE